MIELHSDDYGLFPAQSKRIADCIKKGAINGISIVPNSTNLDRCMDIIKDVDCKYTIHLNFVLGKRMSPISNTEAISKDGMLNCSFSKLMLASISPSIKATYYDELKAEIRAQINATKGYFKDRPLRINSHRHYHMIPIVYDAIIDVIKSENLNVAHIRFPVEPIFRYLKFIGKIDLVRPINLVKVFVLNTLSARNKRKHYDYYRTLNHMEYSGVMYSGNMIVKNTLPILKDAVKRGVDMEMAFHPGGVFESDNLLELGDEEEANFQSSEKRTEETEAVMSLFYSLHEPVKD